MRLGISCLLAAISGFISLSDEILWVRLYSFATRGAANSFGDLLGAFLLGIAFGSYLSRRYCGETESEAGQKRPLRALAGFLLLSNIAAFAVAPIAAAVTTIADPAWSLILYAIVAALLGTSLPLIAHFGVPPGKDTGRLVARVYVCNLLGCTAGSLVTGFVLLDHFQFQTIAAGLLSAGILSAALSFALTCSNIRGMTWAALATAFGAGALAFTVTPTVHHALYEKLQYRKDWRPELAFKTTIENKSGVIAVTQDDAVFGGGAYDGHLSVDPVADKNGIVRAFAIARLHANPKKVLVIGVGSGAWVQVVAHHPGVETVTAIEINPGYFDVIRENDVTRSLLTNSKITWVVDDGRRWLNHHDDRFDLIVQNTTHNWRAHITNLVSKEYQEILRAHLNPGGVFWSNTTWNLSIQKTISQSFSHALRFRSFLAASDSEFNVPKEQARETLERWTIDGKAAFDPADPKAVERIEEILSRGDFEERPAILDRCKDARVVTDDNMATEWWLFR